MAKTKKAKLKDAFELMTGFGYSYEHSLSCDGCFIDSFEDKKDICRVLTCRSVIWKDPNSIGIGTIHGYACIIKAHQ